MQIVIGIGDGIERYDALIGGFGGFQGALSYCSNSLLGNG